MSVNFVYTVILMFLNVSEFMAAVKLLKGFVTWDIFCLRYVRYVSFENCLSNLINLLN